MEPTTVETLHEFGTSFKHRIIALSRAAVEAPHPGAVLGESLHELSCALEEMRVIEEELREQLEEARELAAPGRLEAALYRDLFERAPVALLATDPGGTIREANGEAGSLLQASAKTLVGKPLSVFLPSEDRREFRSRVSRLRAREGEEEDWSLRLLPRGGAPLPVTARIEPRGSRGRDERILWAIAPAEAAAPTGGAAPAPAVAAGPVRRPGPGVDADRLLAGLEAEEGRNAAAFLADRLAERIAGAVYAGVGQEGDALPSIREIARRTGLNHKVVARAYRGLAREGLIEIRERSGVYVALPTTPAPGLAPREEWVAELAEAAWSRQIPPRELLSVLCGVTDAERVHVVCVDATEDDREAMTAELREGFGVSATPAKPDPRTLRALLEAADVAVTTPFHAGLVRRLQPRGQPLLVVVPYADLRGPPGAGEAPVVVLRDEAAVARYRSLGRWLGSGLPRAVKAGGAPRAEATGAARPVWATRAALRALGGEPGELDYRPLRYFEPRSAGRIARLVLAWASTPPGSTPGPGSGAPRGSR